jgi:hypothetical protein
MLPGGFGRPEKLLNIVEKYNFLDVLCLKTTIYEFSTY